LAKIDLRRRAATGRERFDLVFGIVLQAMRSASEARLSASNVPQLVQGILRALGASAEDVERAMRRANDAALPRAAQARLPRQI
jgi:hypothetical protein